MGQPWRLLATTPVVDSPWLKFSRNTFELPTGRTIDDYFTIERSPFVLVVALCDDRLALVHQYRAATNRFYWALPAGYINAGESPTVAAIRELKEETGVEAESARRLGELHPLPGYIQSPAFVVHCEIGSSSAPPLDVDEIDQVLFVPFAETIGMIRDGKIIEMQAVAAILLAAEILLHEKGR